MSGLQNGVYRGDAESIRYNTGSVPLAAEVSHLSGQRPGRDNSRSDKENGASRNQGQGRREEIEIHTSVAGIRRDADLKRQHGSRNEDLTLFTKIRLALDGLIFVAVTAICIFGTVVHLLYYWFGKGL